VIVDNSVLYLKLIKSLCVHGCSRTELFERMVEIRKSHAKVVITVSFSSAITYSNIESPQCRRHH